MTGTGEFTLAGAAPPLDFSGRAIADAKAAIRNQLAPFDAVQTIGAIVAFSVFSVPGRYSEPDTVPSARTEYVVSTLLERGDSSGIRVMTAAQTARASAAIQRALNAASEIGRNTIFSVLAKAERDADPFKQLSARLQLLDAGVRGPGYEFQARDLVTDFFSEPVLETAHCRTLGFTARDAIAFEQATSELVQARMNAALQTATLLSNDMREVGFQIQRRGEHILCITAADLSQHTERPEEVCRAFLECFSVGFGQRSRDTHLLSGRSTIRHRPFVSAPDERFLLTSPVNMVWAIAPVMEDALKDQPEWELAQQLRAAWGEEKVVTALASAIRADATFTGLRYSVNGGSEWYEVDGLVTLDDVCFALEVKAGRLSDKARRGRRRELLPELEELLGRGASQAARLRTAILNGSAIEFVDNNGAPVNVPLAPIKRVEAVVVTLEDFGWLAGLNQQLIDLGLIDERNSVPWIVSVFDFELICSLIEFPGQLMRYLDDRRALDQGSGMDELNLWMVHHYNRLKFPDDTGRIMLRGDWTEEVDRHHMFGHGALPKMPLARATRAAVARVDRERAQGHLSQSETLIKSDQETRLPKPVLTIDRNDRRVSVFSREQPSR